MKNFLSALVLIVLAAMLVGVGIRAQSGTPGKTNPIRFRTGADGRFAFKSAGPVCLIGAISKAEGEGFEVKMDATPDPAPDFPCGLKREK